MTYEILKLNSTGNRVKMVQEKLKILGFYHALVNGIYGLATEEGVRAFQEQYNLQVTGEVDEATWNLLFELTDSGIAAYSNFPTLSYGSSGEEVRDLQIKLQDLLYYTGRINSIFDLETESAVKRFQFTNDLTTSGIVNDQTWNRIELLYGNIRDCAISGDKIEVNYISYMVKKGDTLYQIASRYHTTVDAIKRLNNLTNNVLNIGQVLKIPTTTSSGGNNSISYTVKKGDTLYQIASRYNTTVDAIKSLNNLTSNVLTIGQVLKIPTMTSSGGNNSISYTVKRGDTLYQIASRYNTTVDAIKSLNNLTSNVLTIGQVLKIPTTTSSEGNNSISYTVKRGDTLYQIASRYHTTVDAIKRLNNLTSNILNIGQVLKIPI